jgi:ABC-type spermidine/putrescine transport system permease subunit I
VTAVLTGPPPGPSMPLPPAPRASPVRRGRLFWASLSLPGILWLLLLFLVPLYVVLCLAFGTIDPVFQSPVPVWLPWQWNSAQFEYVFQHLVGPDGFFGPPIVRTVWYVLAASVGALAISYPVAYYVSRFGGKRKGLLLTLLIAPFWISYMMRMLAWVNLLQTDGLINKALSLGGAFNVHVDWLNGRSIVVIMGLIYGYVPYMILPLYAGLDRIDNSLIEGARDLGASRFSTFRRVTLPMSKPAVIAALFLTSLPMIGDYFTNDLLSGVNGTSMLGNLINNAVLVPSQAGQGATFLVLMFVILLAPMVYYVRVTNRAEEETV